MSLLPLLQNVCYLSCREKARQLICNVAGTRVVAVTKNTRGILFDVENQSVDQQYSFAESGLHCASSGFVTTDVGYHAMTSRLRPLSRVLLFDYRQDCSLRCNCALCLELRRRGEESPA